MPDNDLLWKLVAMADRLAFAIKGGIFALSMYPQEVQDALKAYLKFREANNAR